jgi:hypothetical protein
MNRLRYLLRRLFFVTVIVHSRPDQGGAPHGRGYWVSRFGGTVDVRNRR